MNKEQTIAQFLNVKDFPFVIRDKNGNAIYFEDSKGSWVKQEFGPNNNIIYYQNSEGLIKDNRPKKELTMQEIADKFGMKVEDFKIKKQHHEQRTNNCTIFKRKRISF